MKNIIIDHEPVELYKILKFESLVDGGGEAKMAIANGYVSINGNIETQKRKKIRAGDILEFNGETFRITLSDSPKPIHSDKPASTEKTVERTKRRSAINF